LLGRAEDALHVGVVVKQRQEDRYALDDGGRSFGSIASQSSWNQRRTASNWARLYSWSGSNGFGMASTASSKWCSAGAIHWVPEASLSGLLGSFGLHAVVRFVLNVLAFDQKLTEWLGVFPEQPVLDHVVVIRFETFERRPVRHETQFSGDGCLVIDPATRRVLFQEKCGFVIRYRLCKRPVGNGAIHDLGPVQPG